MSIVQPLIELTDSVEILREGKDKKDLFLKGISIQAEIINGNNRKYPIAVAEDAVNIYIKERLSKNIASGELDHPDNKIHKINPDRISHKFVEINQDGNNFITKAKVLNTTCGKQVRNLIEGEISLGMSSRGFGKTNVKEGIAIVENLYLVTMADVVVDPSAPDAWQQAVYENKEWIFENGVLVEQNVEPIIDNVKKALNTIPAGRRNKIIIEEFKKYLKTITK